MRTAKRIAIVLVALCTLAGATAGVAASMPVPTPDEPIATTGGPAATGVPGTAMGGPAAANGPTGQASDCEIVDVDGNDSTVSVDLTTNTTTGEDGNVTVRLRCMADDATSVDHDLIDIDGNNNTVRVVVGSENGTVLLGGATETVEDRRLGVALDCMNGGAVADCDAIDVDGNNNSVALVVRNDDGWAVHELDASDSEPGANDEDDDGNGHVDEDDESDAGLSNDDDDGDGCIDEDDEPDDGDDGSDDFNGHAEDDDDGDGCIDENDEPDSGNSDDVDNDGDGAIDEDDEGHFPGNGTGGDN